MTNMTKWARKNHKEKREIDTWAHRISSLIPNSIPTYTMLTTTTTSSIIARKSERKKISMRIRKLNVHLFLILWISEYYHFLFYFSYRYNYLNALSEIVFFPLLINISNCLTSNIDRRKPQAQVISSVNNGRRPLSWFFSQHMETMDPRRQLSLELEVYKYLIIGNVRHTLVTSTRWAMDRAHFSLQHTQPMWITHFSFSGVWWRKKFYRKREKRGGRERERKALRRQSQIRRTCFEVTTTTSKRRKDYH